MLRVVDTTYLKYGASERPELVPFIPEAANSLLDIGCGAGGFGRTLRRLRPEIELWAVEPDPVSARVAEDAFDRVIVSNFPNESIPDGRFDVVLCADVLEHMAEPEKALLAAADALTDKGIMLASIPNVRNLRRVVWPLVMHGAWSYTETGILDRTHLRFFTRKSIVDFFTANNWAVESIAGIALPGRREKLMSALTLRRFDDFLFMQYVVVARPVRVRKQ
jgi:2-polyprenyl-3-methyl-5-hydroxy-6-metoxy-1,4-benzoquinol methylase